MSELHRDAGAGRAGRLQRLVAILYAVGTVALLTGVGLLFAAYSESGDTLEDAAIASLTAAWFVLVIAAVLDVVRSRQRPRPQPEHSTPRRP